MERYMWCILRRIRLVRNQTYMGFAKSESWIRLVRNQTYMGFAFSESWIRLVRNQTYMGFALALGVTGIGTVYLLSSIINDNPTFIGDPFILSK